MGSLPLNELPGEGAGAGSAVSWSTSHLRKNKPKITTESVESTPPSMGLRTAIQL